MESESLAQMRAVHTRCEEIVRTHMESKNVHDFDFTMMRDLRLVRLTPESL